MQNDINTDNRNQANIKDQPANFGGDFELGLLLGITKKSIPWVILLIAASITCAFLYLRYTPLIFESKATLQLTNENTSENLYDAGSLYQTSDISAEIELIRSVYFLKKAVEKLPSAKLSYYNQGNVLFFEQYPSAPYEVNIIDHNPEVEEAFVYVTFELLA